jgi:hypothetical protein
MNGYANISNILSASVQAEIMVMIDMLCILSLAQNSLCVRKFQLLVEVAIFVTCLVILPISGTRNNVVPLLLRVPKRS